MARPRKSIPNEELAAILAFATANGDKAASQKFGVSCRTLQRHREAIRAGRVPELAALVAENNQRVSKECQDLLTSTYEKALRALAKRIDSGDMKDWNLIGAVQTLGSQRLTRDLTQEGLSPDQDDAESTASDRGSPTASAHARSVAGAAPGTSGGPRLH